MTPPLPFPFPLNIGTDIVHIPRIARLLTTRKTYFNSFTRRILTAEEQLAFRTRFNLPNNNRPGTQTSDDDDGSTAAQALPPLNIESSSSAMTRWLAGRFAAKEAARKAAPTGAAAIGWKDVLVRIEEEDDMTADAENSLRGSKRPEVVYLDEGNNGARVGKLSISHDGEYVVATVLAAH